MKKPIVKRVFIASVVLTVILGGTILVGAIGHSKSDASARKKISDNPLINQSASLTVTTLNPRLTNWPQVLVANGNVSAWQEAIVGSELGGLRLVEVLVSVGDVVHRGQVLARFESESVAADVAQQQAALEEAQASLFEAEANAERARTLSSSGMLSKQQTTKDLTTERSAQARLLSAKARLQAEQIRMRQTQVVAPDDGVISSRSATVGAVAQQGMELFRLIRKGRLEWRADVTSIDLLRIKSSQSVTVIGPNDTRVRGSVRMIAPTVDPATRNAIVYVDLPKPADLHAGMFATGQFEIGHAEALVVPQSAIVTRDGYNYVFQVVAKNKVLQTKVDLGRRVGDEIEVIRGVSTAMTLVGQGAGFLADGDTVNIVGTPVLKTAIAADTRASK